MSTEKFRLKWNDFESNISTAFKELRADCELFDCTLSAGGKKIQAHKLILSACSSFFRHVFKDNVHQHPLIYLRGVSSSDLMSVLDFMYHGEVRVCQSELNQFLALAEDLEIKGLTQTSGPQSQTRSLPPDGDRVRPFPTITSPNSQTIVEIKSEAPPSSGAPSTNENDSFSEEFEEQQQSRYDKRDTEDGNYHQLEPVNCEAKLGSAILELDSPYSDVVSKHALAIGGGKYSCNLCHINARDKYNMRRHLETTHDLSTGYQCELCRKQFKAKHQLTVHKARGCGVSLPPF